MHRTAMRYPMWLLRPLPTRVLGPRYRRSRDEVISIDITYVCDLRCFNCNRSCSQDPTTDRMSLGQICRFLDESKGRQIRWKRINILGGEPTCHPDFLEIVDLVVGYRDEFSPNTGIEVYTNGHSKRARRLTSQLPAGVKVIDSSKDSPVQPAFHTFNVAPIDLPDYRKVEYSNACPETEICGMGVTPYGYYPCPLAGAIDRTFGFDLGRKTFPEDDDDMIHELRRFCPICGAFKTYVGTWQDTPLDGPVMSLTWVEAYERSRCDPAQLSRLPEAEEAPAV